MPADIDVLVGIGSSPISFTSNYPFESDETEDYQVPRDLLNPESSDPGKESPLDFPWTALGSSPNSGTYPVRHSTGPVFGSSPPTHFTFHGRCSSPTLRNPSSPPVSLPRTLNQPLRLLTSSDGHLRMPVAVPRRPCLVVRCDLLNLPSPGKSKKKVVFADDKGFPLALVRTMTEPSNVPPQWSLQFFSKTNHPKSRRESPVSDPWEINFPQPASDYLDFRRRLDANNVSLENVIVRESEQIVFGTVKLRNLAYQKEVFVRMTGDDWKTQEDTFCTYVPNGPPALGVAILYDTFSFRLTLPPRSRKIEFCVCFRCSGIEYWDNGNGKNYVISKRNHHHHHHHHDPHQQHHHHHPSQARGKFDSSSVGREMPNNDFSRQFGDQLKSGIQLESWTEFASWNHLNNDAPYW